MNTLTEGIRSVLGEPNFLVNGSIDYGLLMEYFAGLLILCIVVSSIFKILKEFFK